MILFTLGCITGMLVGTVRLMNYKYELVRKIDKYPFEIKIGSDITHAQLTSIGYEVENMKGDNTQ